MKKTIENLIMATRIIVYTMILGKFFRHIAPTFFAQNEKMQIAIAMTIFAIVFMLIPIAFLFVETYRPEWLKQPHGLLYILVTGDKSFSCNGYAIGTIAMVPMTYVFGIIGAAFCSALILNGYSGQFWD